MRNEDLQRIEISIRGCDVKWCTALVVWLVRITTKGGGEGRERERERGEGSTVFTYALTITAKWVGLILPAVATL